jgi:prophage regulatory protein
MKTLNHDTEEALKMNPATMPRIRFLNVKEVAAMLGISKSTVWLWCQKGHLPQPARLGRKCSRWLESDVEDAILRISGKN